MSSINVASTLPVKHVCKLSDPFVGHPLGPQENWTPAVQHVHVGPAAPTNVVPEDGRAAGGRDSNSKPSEGGVTSPWHFGQV